MRISKVFYRCTSCARSNSCS